MCYWYWSVPSYFSGKTNFLPGRKTKSASSNNLDTSWGHFEVGQVRHLALQHDYVSGKSSQIKLRRSQDHGFYFLGAKTSSSVGDWRNPLVFRFPISDCPATASMICPHTVLHSLRDAFLIGAVLDAWEDSFNIWFTESTMKQIVCQTFLFPPSTPEFEILLKNIFFLYPDIYSYFMLWEVRMHLECNIGNPFNAGGWVDFMLCCQHGDILMTSFRYSKPGFVSHRMLSLWLKVQQTAWGDRKFINTSD